MPVPALATRTRYGAILLSAFALNLTAPLDFPTFFSLSKAAYLSPFFLLGLVIEKVSGTSLDQTLWRDCQMSLPVAASMQTTRSPSVGVAGSARRMV